MREIRGAIFDVDGLLFNTEQLYCDICMELAPKYGIENYDREYYKKYVGTSNKALYEIYQNDFPFLSLEDIDRFIKAVQGIAESHLEVGDVEIKTGAKEILEFLSSNNIPCVIASNNQTKFIKSMLNHHDIHLHFQKIYSLDDIVHPKPHPEILNKASELVLKTEESEKLFVNIAKKLKSAYNLVSGTELFTYKEVEEIHFYFAVSSIVRKLTKGEAPDTAQMNAKVAKLVEEAIISEGVEEIFKLDDNKANTIDLFNDKFIEKISNLELPNTKIKILERLLKQTINDFKKVNKVKGQDFSERLQSIINRYNERSEGDILDYEGIQFDTAEQMIELIIKLRAEMDSFQDLGIDYEEKAFYDILDMICKQYGFEFDNDKMLELAREIKKIVDNTAKYPDWNDRDDIKAQLKMDIIVKLHEFGYPPITQEDVYKNVLEQAENFKKNR